jgi:hypothetical protein
MAISFRTTSQKYKDSIAACQAELSSIIDVRNQVISEIEMDLKLMSIKASAFESLGTSVGQLNFTRTELKNFIVNIKNVSDKHSSEEETVKQLQKILPDFSLDQEVIDDVDIKTIGLYNKAIQTLPKKPTVKQTKRSLKKMSDYEYAISDFIIERLLSELTLTICYCEMYESVFEQYIEEEVSWKDCLSWLKTLNDTADRLSKDPTSLTHNEVKEKLKIPDFQQQYQKANNILLSKTKSFVEETFERLMRKKLSC